MTANVNKRKDFIKSYLDLLGFDTYSDACIDHIEQVVGDPILSLDVCKAYGMYYQLLTKEYENRLVRNTLKGVNPLCQN